jgi:hypothetical protein
MAARLTGRDGGRLRAADAGLENTVLVLSLIIAIGCFLAGLPLQAAPSPALRPEVSRALAPT